MHDGINLFLGHDVGDEVRTANVSLDEFEVFETRDFLEVGETGAVVEFVVDDYLVVWVLLREEDGCMGCDESWIN